MHIVQVAPPWFPIPPRGYGGIERVVYDLIEGFLADGHRVTLFAPATSHTRACLIPTVGEGVGLDWSADEKADIFARTSRQAFDAARGLHADVLHDHTDYLPQAWDGPPIFRTIHGGVTTPFVDLYHQASVAGDHLIAISRRQKELFEQAATRRFGPSGLLIRSVMHNPIDVRGTAFYPRTSKQDYLAFVGRCHWEKAPDVAIAVARQAGISLKMAMRISREEQEYFRNVVEPLLQANAGLVEFVGEVDGQEKDELIGQASALLFTSRWEEPFGLVMTESLARGTPVLAFSRGSAPEVVRHGVTGALCADEAEMVASLPWVTELDPAACRRDAEQRFDRITIARQHIRLFTEVVSSTVPWPRFAPNADAAGWELELLRTGDAASMA